MAEGHGTMGSNERFVLKFCMPTSGDDICFNTNLRDSVDFMFSNRYNATQEALQPIVVIKGPIFLSVCGDGIENLRRHPGAVEVVVAVVFKVGSDAIEQIKPKLEIGDGNEVLAFTKYFAVTFYSMFSAKGLKPWVCLMRDIQCKTLYNEFVVSVERQERLLAAAESKKQ
jgi:hypothetical protein